MGSGISLNAGLVKVFQKTTSCRNSTRGVENLPIRVARSQFVNASQNGPAPDGLCPLCRVWIKSPPKATLFDGRFNREWTRMDGNGCDPRQFSGGTAFSRIRRTPPG